MALSVHGGDLIYFEFGNYHFTPGRPKGKVESLNIFSAGSIRGKPKWYVESFLFEPFL